MLNPIAAVYICKGVWVLARASLSGILTWLLNDIVGGPGDF